MQTTVLFNLFEFRRGIWLPKAYVVSLDANGRPRSVHETAKLSGLSIYGITPDAALERALALLEWSEA